MTKNDLKTGMIVESKGGWLGIVHRGTGDGDFIHWMRDESGVPINKYRTFDALFNDLTYPIKGAANGEIIRVYAGYNLYRNIDSPEKMLRDKVLLWTSPDYEPKEVTMAEVEEKFGCKVKIIAEE